MDSLEDLRSSLPEAARDIKLNLQAVLTSGPPLSDDQRWGVALAAAFAARNPRLSAALLQQALSKVGSAVIEDARAAAALMAMNNVYYRFRHLIGQPTYSQKPARLRMNRLAATAGPKVDFELFCLAVGAISGCGACLQAHESVVRAAGLTDDHVHEAVRIAATLQATAIALELPPLPAPA